jgi:hypothetical protein
LKSRFQNLPFKCNLQRYNEYQLLGRMNAAAAEKYGEMGEVVAGLGVFMNSLRRGDVQVQ